MELASPFSIPMALPFSIPMALPFSIPIAIYNSKVAIKMQRKVFTFHLKSNENRFRCGLNCTKKRNTVTQQLFLHQKTNMSAADCTKEDKISLLRNFVLSETEILRIRSDSSFEQSSWVLRTMCYFETDI